MTKCKHIHWEPSFRQVGQTVIGCAYCLDCKQHLGIGKGTVEVISPLRVSNGKRYK